MMMDKRKWMVEEKRWWVVVRLQRLDHLRFISMAYLHGS
jgi:hypothetical protein